MGEDATENLLPCRSQQPNLFSVAWLQVWFVIFSITMVSAMQNLLVPVLAPKVLNDGVDPCIENGSDSIGCIHALEFVTEIITTTATVSFIFLFFASPFLGSLCDVVGRKPIWLAVLALSSTSTLVFQAAITKLIPFECILFSMVNLQILVIVSTLVWTLAIADQLPVEYLEVGFGISTGFGFLGSLIATSLAVIVSTSACVAVTSIVTIIALFVGIRIPETLTSAKSKEAVTMRKQIRMLSDFASWFFRGRYRKITGILFFAQITPAGIGSIFLVAWKAIYGINKDSAATANLIMFVSSAFVMMALMQSLSDLLGPKGLILLSSVTAIAVLFGYGFSPSLEVLYFVKIFEGLFSLFPPTVSATFYRLTPPHVRAYTQGALISMQCVAGALGPLVYGTIFAYFEEPHSHSPQFPQAPFVVGCIAWMVVIGVIAPMEPSMFSELNE